MTFSLVEMSSPLSSKRGKPSVGFSLNAFRYEIYKSFGFVLNAVGCAKFGRLSITVCATHDIAEIRGDIVRAFRSVNTGNSILV